MLEVLAPAIALGFIAGLMPGPLQSFLLLQTLRHGPRRAGWIVAAPLLCDGPIIAASLLVLNQAGDGLLRGLALVGGLFLVYLSWESFRGLREETGPDQQVAEVSAGTSGWALLIRAALISGLGPAPWVFWGTVTGPLLVQYWRSSIGHALAFLISFYGIFIALLVAQLLLFSFARRLGPKITRGGAWLGLGLLIVFALLLLLYGLGAIDRFGV